MKRTKRHEDLFGNKIIDIVITRKGRPQKGTKQKVTWQLFINQILIDRELRKANQTKGKVEAY
ncbi:hypothetical protein [Ornithinibacillus sp. JPR2-1]|uniref:hypothetical protein n=1 Tax=Ornithinibacillus sp. JPR2-1 TaxID=2094019 RepID=UPI0031DCE81E